jgi:thiol-disulfide isomerase/thioredoxin
MKRKLLWTLAAGLLLFGAAAAWMLGPALLPTKHVEAGLAVGQKAPVAMALRDAAGKETTLASGMQAKGAVVLLVRSADWCPFCKAQLIRTQGIAAEVGRLGYGLAAVSYDDPAKLARFAGDKGPHGSRRSARLDPDPRPGRDGQGQICGRRLPLAANGRAGAGDDQGGWVN